MASRFRHPTSVTDALCGCLLPVIHIGPSSTSANSNAENLSGIAKLLYADRIRLAHSTRRCDSCSRQVINKHHLDAKLAGGQHVTSSLYHCDHCRVMQSGGVVRSLPEVVRPMDLTDYLGYRNSACSVQYACSGLARSLPPEVRFDFCNDVNEI